jgi:hypothetical protein
MKKKTTATMTYQQALSYARGNCMSVDGSGYLITRGCEGVGAAEWRKIQMAAEAFAQHVGSQPATREQRDARSRR